MRLVISDILFFLTKRLSDSKIVIVTDPTEIKSHLNHNRAVVIAHFKDNKTLKYKFFNEALSDNDDVDILVGFGDTDMGVSHDSFCIYSSANEYWKFESKWEVDTIKKWVYVHSFPIVIPYEARYNRFIFSKQHEIKSLIVYMSDNNEPVYNLELYSILKEISEHYMGESFVVDMLADAGNMIDFFGFEREILPVFFYVFSLISVLNL